MQLIPCGLSQYATYCDKVATAQNQRLWHFFRFFKYREIFMMQVIPCGLSQYATYHDKVTTAQNQRLWLRFFKYREIFSYTSLVKMWMMSIFDDYIKIVNGFYE